MVIRTSDTIVLAAIKVDESESDGSESLGASGSLQSSPVIVYKSVTKD